MEEDDLVLSEVHIAPTEHMRVGSVPYNPKNSSNSTLIDVAVTRFQFAFPRHLDESDFETGLRGPGVGGVAADRDGDLDVPRPRKLATEVVTIEHGLASPLPLVGLQVWLGALLLADYVMHLGRSLNGKCILELGAGTGLCSIVAALFAKRVICTDIGSDVLSQCQRNVEKNADLIKRIALNPSAKAIRVRELDWRHELPAKEKEEETRDFRWSDYDLRALNDCDVIMAADVIYDDDITDCLFTLLSKLLLGQVQKLLYLSLERRLNFTLSSLDVACPAYDHFLAKIAELKACGATAKKLDLNFTQCFRYERSKYLELWKISFAS